MSVHLSAAVWRMPDIEPIRKLLLLKLADNANDDGFCWPSVTRICRETGISRRTVFTHLAALEEAGILERRPPPPDRETTTYFLKIGMQQDAATCNEGKEVVREPHRGGAGAAPGGVHQPHGGGAGAAHRTVIEPPIEPPLKKAPRAAAAALGAPEIAAAMLQELGAEFATFAAFPLALGEWLAFRFTVKRSKVTPEAAHRLCVKLKPHGPEVAAKALTISVDRGWTGVFPDSVNREAGGKPAPQGVNTQPELGKWGY